jgi:hypothetical protein
MSTESETCRSAEETSEDERSESGALRVIGWFSIGMVVAALGIYVGAELRNRYKFKRRTPYDFYSNAGERQVGEFGMGI